MELKGSLVVVVVVLVGIGSLSYVSEAYEFHVGGENGWVARPCEEYNHWAERTRFQVNDTLVFKYKKGSESVHVVKKDDYYSCNANNSLLALTGGDSTFKFDRSGPFFFISGDADACRNGQRLVVVVLAVRCNSPPPPPPPARAAPPPPPRDVINTASYSVAPAPAPSGSVAGSAGWALSVACVGALGVVFW